MPTEVNIIATPELIRYLALFHRFFATMRAYVRDQDEDGIVLITLIADALHNVPDMLWRRNSKDDTERMADWIKGYPLGLRNSAPPARILTTCDAIISLEGVAAELGLTDDLSNLDLAPPEAIAAHVDLFYHACLEIRWRHRHPWSTGNAHWEERREGTKLAMEKLAEILADVPTGLVHWHQFDEAGFAQKASPLWNWPEGFGAGRDY